MKNIHIIPTDKPSRLYKHNELGFKLLAPVEHEIGAYNGSNQNIYITNDEEIKEGDYVINNLDKLIGKSIRELNSAEIKDREYSKIILTTDQDLINDGVQAIDNEFLEWFVKNPSCESVDINRDWGYPKIIIPQEEPKTNLERLPFPELVKEFAEYYKKVPLVVEPKQETLEEAIERLIELNRQDSFYEGAKWQAKRMYNDAECYRFLHDLMTDIKLQGLIITDDIDLKKWFEQHKKK
jgi:hypothetical protein